MTRIKICGLRRPEDIAIANRCHPDYAGFIVDFPKSFRSVEPAALHTLTDRLDPAIPAVGVFVDEDPAVIEQLVRINTIQMVQLHGHETPAMIRTVQSFGAPVIKAFVIRSEADLQPAIDSPADAVLLDAGQGSGRTFDWSLLKQMDRPFILAGGLNPDNLSEAIQTLRPAAVDISSGAETNQIKDEQKIKQCIALCRKEQL